MRETARAVFMKTTTMIDISKYTAHKTPGKFEGESPATEYFYEQSLDGVGETIYCATPETEDEDLFDLPNAELFRVHADEAEAFGLPIGATFMLREDSQGFVYGSIHGNREEAQRRFNRGEGA